MDEINHGTLWVLLRAAWQSQDPLIFMFVIFLIVFFAWLITRWGLWGGFWWW